MLKYLIQKEFLQIRRNSFLPKLIIMFPIVVMCVMPWVMQMEVKNVVVDVVDIDHTMESQRLIQQVVASNYFIFGGQKATYDEAMKDIEKGDADIILEIRDGKYLIAANAVNGTKGAMGSSYLSQIVNSHQPVSFSNLSILKLYNKGQDYKLFMIPALFAIVMMLMIKVVVHSCQTHSLLAHGAIRHHRLLAVGMDCLWHYACWTSVARICACHAAGTVFLIIRTHRVQLFRHHAAGDVRDVVLRGQHHAALWTFHPYALYATVGILYHLCQPHALLHRCHPHRIHPRRRLV